MPLFDSSPACLPGLRFWLPGLVRGLVGPRMPTRSLGSRACSFSTCVRLWDYAGPAGNSRLRSRQCGLPVACTRSAPGIRFSKLDSSPVDASVYTSPGTSQHPAQDSRSRWFATPFLWGSFIPDCTPVYPDACACLRMAALKRNAQIVLTRPSERCTTPRLTASLHSRNRDLAAGSDCRSESSGFPQSYLLNDSGSVEGRTEVGGRDETAALEHF